MLEGLVCFRSKHKALTAVVLGLGAAVGVAATPVSPYKALNLPNSITPTLKAAPIRTIMAGSLSIQLEVTSLGSVKERFGGETQKAGDAGDAVTWLCYAGKNDEHTPVVYWFVSNNEMGGLEHRVTQVAVQVNSEGKVPEGCSNAPAALSGVDFGVPSIGATIAALVKHFGGGKPDTKGNLSYASELPAAAPKGATVGQSVQYRVRSGSVVIVSVSQVTTN